MPAGERDVLQTLESGLSVTKGLTATGIGGMAFVVVRGVSKTYRNADVPVPVFDNLDLEVERGEMLAIVGPSGIGKSTLLHLLGGLDQADSGSIAIGEAELTKMGSDALARFRNRHVWLCVSISSSTP